ncbi:MAG: YqeG family HAD IIIA-type phosphatase [Lachnospiraceae bacterium]|jgi:HAD superfamily phosphatase (TIGR01668 family)|nr:YqeG family HAD IIIA-type phosphatase [Lachnospiraceae bacterium]
MFNNFYPDNYIVSTYVIPFDKLYEEGYRAIIFDIDNTLVRHGAPADKRSIALFRELRRLGYEIVLLSNNDEPRVKMFSDAVGGQYIHKAGKPLVKNYHRAMEMMGTDTTNTMFVGDQIFTDIWGARSAGIYTWLVRPINKKEEIQIILKRIPEQWVLACYRRKCRRENRVFLIN